MAKTYKEKIKEAKNNNIELPDVISDRNIVGIYKFFRAKENEKPHCFYIGKSTNIAYRLLGSSFGHIYMYLNNNISKLVPIKINEYLKKGYKIKVEIIEVDYYAKEFTIAAHRLALTELNEIVKYQEQGQCEFQLPEGVGMYEKKFWNDNYKILK